MVVNRMQASCSVQFKQAKNITTGETDYVTNNANIVSLAPELSLATIGSTIPVIEVPEGMPCPTLQEMAYVLTQIGHMVIHREVPKHTIEGLGDDTRTIPNIYLKGKEALTYCARKVRQQQPYNMI